MGCLGSGAGSVVIGGDGDRVGSVIGVGEAVSLGDSVALGLFNGSGEGLMVGDSVGVAVVVGLFVWFCFKFLKLCRISFFQCTMVVALTDSSDCRFVVLVVVLLFYLADDFPVG